MFEIDAAMLYRNFLLKNTALKLDTAIFRFQTNCAVPIRIGDEFGPLKVIGFITSRTQTTCPVAGYREAEGDDDDTDDEPILDSSADADSDDSSNTGAVVAGVVVAAVVVIGGVVAAYFYTQKKEDIPTYASSDAQSQ